MNILLIAILVVVCVLFGSESTRNWKEIRDAPDFNTIVARFLVSMVVIAALAFCVHLTSL